MKLHPPWSILEIAPTAEVRAIKRAYAAKLKITRPDEDRDGFMVLRSAYESALAMAPYIELERYESAYDGDKDEREGAAPDTEPEPAPALEQSEASATVATVQATQATQASQQGLHIPAHLLTEPAEPAPPPNPTQHAPAEPQPEPPPPKPHFQPTPDTSILVPVQPAESPEPLIEALQRLIHEGNDAQAADCLLDAWQAQSIRQIDFWPEVEARVMGEVLAVERLPRLFFACEAIFEWGRGTHLSMYYQSRCNELRVAYLDMPRRARINRRAFGQWVDVIHGECAYCSLPWYDRWLEMRRKGARAYKEIAILSGQISRANPAQAQALTQELDDYFKQRVITPLDILIVILFSWFNLRNVETNWLGLLPLFFKDMLVALSASMLMQRFWSDSAQPQPKWLGPMRYSHALLAVCAALFALSIYWRDFLLYFIAVFNVFIFNFLFMVLINSPFTSLVSIFLRLVDPKPYVRHYERKKYALTR